MVTLRETLQRGIDQSAASLLAFQLEVLSHPRQQAYDLQIANLGVLLKVVRVEVGLSFPLYSSDLVGQASRLVHHLLDAHGHIIELLGDVSFGTALHIGFAEDFGGQQVTLCRMLL